MGVEAGEFKNADIHPEYVTTVEVAKALSAWDRNISLETHMKDLRRDAYALSLQRNGLSTRSTASKTVSNYRFGKKDSQRLDVVVSSPDPVALPILLAEAKLGINQRSGVIKDVDRILRLLDMYHDLGLLKFGEIYGAAVFHSWLEGSADGAPNQKALKLEKRVDKHLKDAMKSRPWLNARVGYLSKSVKIQSVVGYTEFYSEEHQEEVFAKDSFAFIPGLVLLGNSSDVNTASF